MAQDLPLAEELAGVYARMSGLLLSKETVASALSVVTTLAAETLPGTTGSGVTLNDERGGRTTAGASSPVALRADELQYELDQGPCLSAWRERAVVRVDDLTTETRWPDWAGAAASLGLRSALSAPLVAEDRSMGAIKVYSEDPAAYDERDERLLSLFAAQAAVLIANVRTMENARRVSDELRDALRSRDVIGLAKGVLIGREGVDEEVAFAMLVTAAEREGRPLRDAADGLVQSAQRRRR